MDQLTLTSRIVHRFGVSMGTDLLNRKKQERLDFLVFFSISGSFYGDNFLLIVLCPLQSQKLDFMVDRQKENHKRIRKYKIVHDNWGTMDYHDYEFMLIAESFKNRDLKSYICWKRNNRDDIKPYLESESESNPDEY